MSDRASVDAPASAGVHYPPPLIYVTGLAAAWLLGRWHPLAITAGGSSVRMIGAIVLLAFWVVLALSAVAVFRSARTAVLPHRPATTIVTRGPFRFTRNPMYLAFVAAYLGAALLMNSWWAVLLLPLVVLVVGRAVITREERYLSAAFPADYAAYRARVRRWL